MSTTTFAGDPSPTPTASATLMPSPTLSPSPVPTPTPTPTKMEKPVAVSAPSDEVELDSIENSTVRFKIPSGQNYPSTLKTDLFDLKLLGKLKPADGAPYFLFVAKPCQDCAQDSAIYLLRPGHGKVTSFVYPGRILDSKTKALLLESRAFFGKCLPNTNDAYVVFQKERVDRRRSPQASVYIAEAEKDHLEERLIERHLPSINQALTYVKRKQCHEVDGRYRVMTRRPLELRYLSREKDEEEDSKDSKEGE